MDKFPVSNGPDARSAINAGRRRFLGYTGAGAAASFLPIHGALGAPARSYPDTIAWGRQAIRAVIAKHPKDVASVSIALLKDGHVVWREAFGYAHVQDKTTATVDTRYNIGSVSKVIAALAAVILQDRGLLRLDTPIVQYLPQFTMATPEYRHITTRHLLSHASGLPGTNGKDIFTFEAVPGYAAATLAALKGHALKHAPGELAVYCNDGFTLVEPVVEAVAGQPFAAFVQENILNPLGMHHSSFLTGQALTGTFARPYRDGRSHPREYCNAYASGGLSTTPSDMMHMAQMFLDGGLYEGRRIVSEASIANMATDQTRRLSIMPPPGWQWGLGWDTVAHPAPGSAGVTAWEKSGGTAFFQTEFFVLPQARMALLVTGNSGYKPLAIAEEVLMRALAEDATISKVPALVRTTMPAPAPAPDLSAAAGFYGNHLEPVRVTQGTDGTLILTKWNGQSWVPLDEGIASYRHGADGWWWGTGDTPHSYAFDVQSGTDSAGQPYSYRYLMQRDARFGAGYSYLVMPYAQQLEARSALDDAWKAHLRTRTWQVTNLSSTDVSYVLSEGKMTFNLSALAELPGYLLFDNQPLVPIASDRGGMILKLPVNMGRDLYEITFSGAAGEEVLAAGTYRLVAA